MPISRQRRTFAVMLVTILTAAVLAGCSTRISKVVQADSSAPGGWEEVSLSNLARVDVRRNGQRLDSRTSLNLKPGDVVETGPRAGALIRFENGGEAILAPSTKVQLGSLEVFFGEVLVDLRGKFEVYNQRLVAALRGTRFLFESRPGRLTRVAVLEGSVNCISRSGSWEPVRLDTGRQLRADYSTNRRPQPMSLTPREIASIERRFTAIRDAAEKGFCCSGRGTVRESYSNQCQGHFERTRREAERQCEKGWCCRKGSNKPHSSIRGDCRYRFYTDYKRAAEACKPPPPPQPAIGLCCFGGGKHTRLTQSDCVSKGGKFYANYNKCPVQ